MDAETARQERIMGIRQIVRQIKADIAAKRERKEVKHVPPYRRLPHGGAGVCAGNALPQDRGRGIQIRWPPAWGLFF